MGYIRHRLVLLVEAHLARAGWLLFQCHSGEICRLGNVTIWLLLQHASPKATSQSSHPYGSYPDGIDASCYTVPRPGPHIAFYTVHCYLQSPTTQRIPLHNLRCPTSYGRCCARRLLYLDPPHQVSPLPTRLSHSRRLHSPQPRGINSHASDLLSQLSRRAGPLSISRCHLPHHLAFRNFRSLRNDLSPHGHPLLHDRRNTLPRTTLPQRPHLQISSH